MNSQFHRLLSFAALIALSYSSYWPLRLAWADRLSRTPGIAGRERATTLAPANASLYMRLADAREEAGADPIPDLRRAAALDPENPAIWMRLGQRAELAGDLHAAEQYLLRAAQQSRLYQPRYLLTQFYFRQDDEVHFEAWLRAALNTAPGDAAPLFNLAWRLHPAGEWLLHNALGRRTAIARQYLGFLTGKQAWPAAALLARDLSARGDSADLEALVAWCDANLRESTHAADTIAVWNTMCRRKLVPYPPLDSAAGGQITDPAFDRAPLNAGFAWRLIAAPGITVAFRRGGLRVGFSGHQPERCTILWQYIPLQPGARYRLTWNAEGADAGLLWNVEQVPVEVESAHAIRITADREIARLALIYQRPPGSTRLDGPVALSALKLEKLP